MHGWSINLNFGVISFLAKSTTLSRWLQTCTGRRDLQACPGLTSCPWKAHREELEKMALEDAVNSTRDLKESLQVRKRRPAASEAAKRGAAWCRSIVGKGVLPLLVGNGDGGFSFLGAHSCWM